ncbi:MoxR family ATPase [Paenibacillus sp. MAHUQ-46]|uniref:MoxR family ATPase n=2 Tax=Paenibacillus TaxID=44249 RepID=A0A934MLN7_9BACL|nr:MoxR family ATPase [Paenibacillus roseus]
MAADGEEQDQQTEWNQEGYQWLRRMQSRLEDVLLGKPDTVRLAMTALLAGGHLLLEDVPGVGKTVLARAFAKAVGGQFGRIQFTSDLQPADVTGGSVWDNVQRDFVYRPGPVMNHVVLADELNRTTPRTQSALLEAMEERSVTVDGTTRLLPEPFMLIATQNPLRDEGTFPLPEAQLDRFMMRLSIGYPAAADEIRMLEHRSSTGTIGSIKSLMSPEQWLELQRQAQQVHVDRSLLAYVVDIAAATRTAPQLSLGASPRASRDWVRAAQAAACMEGRGYAVPDDFKGTAVPVLSHRLVMKPQHEANGWEQASILEQMIQEFPLPRKMPTGTWRVQ